MRSENSGQHSLWALPEKHAKEMLPYFLQNGQRQVLRWNYSSINCSKNAASLRIGTPSSRAFLFLADSECTSLLIRKLVFFVTLPVTFPPPCSMKACNSLRFAKCSKSPVITNVKPASGLFSCFSSGLRRESSGRTSSSRCRCSGS